MIIITFVDDIYAKVLTYMHVYDFTKGTCLDFLTFYGVSQCISPFKLKTNLN